MSEASCRKTVDRNNAMSLNQTNSPTPFDQLRQSRGVCLQPSRFQLSLADQDELKAILDEPSKFMDHPSFHRPRAEERLFRKPPAVPVPNTKWYDRFSYRRDDLEAQAVSANAVLTRDQEKTLFLQYNYARYRVATMKRRHRERAMTVSQARELLRWHRLAMGLREQIAGYNLALVPAMTKRLDTSHVDLSELLCEGNLVLLRTIDKFRVDRGFKFSTYACFSILRELREHIGKEIRRRRLFPVAFDPSLEKPDDYSALIDAINKERFEEICYIVDQNEAELTEVERQVLHHRFPIGVDTANSPLTLAEVGKIIGYSKEHVRKLQKQALAKLRSVFISNRRKHACSRVHGLFAVTDEGAYSRDGH